MHALYVLAKLHQCRQIIHVLQTLADRLKNDGKVGVFPCHIQKLGGALTLLPQWGTLTGVMARQQ